jgi:hypothetical protein
LDRRALARKVPTWINQLEDDILRDMINEVTPTSKAAIVFRQRWAQEL